MSKKSSKAQRRRNRDYWNRKKRSKYKPAQASAPEKLSATEPNKQQGLRLPSAKQAGKLLLMEAEDGSLVDVPEESLGDWAEMQGQGAETQEQKDAEGKVLDMVMEMLYGKEEKG